MQTTARSLILDLLSTLRHGTMPVRALVEAGALLEIGENNIRVSLARLYASGRIERDERGRYRLGPAVAAISGQLRSWRDLTGRTQNWSGDWIAVHQAKLGRGPLRRRRERALRLFGFRELAAGFSVRPDNLRLDLSALRRELMLLTGSNALGAPNPAEDDADASLGRVFIARDFDPRSDLEARSLWDADRLAQDAHASTRRLRESAAQIDRLSKEAAMVETFLVGGTVLRQLVSHPLLPAEILDPQPLATLLAEMKQYDKLGRACWAPFLARHAVPHRALPLDSRRSSEDLVTLLPGLPVRD
jgi:phenylacetic acid degradation operon negative regulatory protein